MSGGYGSDAGTQSDASSTNQRPVEHAADMASRRARSDLSTASTGQASDAATHERQPNAPTDAGRQGDAKPTHQNAIEHGADASSRAARSDLKDISVKQATDKSTPSRPADMSRDTGRHDDTLSTRQRMMGPSADAASRATRSDLSSLSIPQTADAGGRQLRPDQWNSIVEEREPLVRSGTQVEPTPEEINARASLIGLEAVSRSAASNGQESIAPTEAHITEDKQTTNADTAAQPKTRERSDAKWHDTAEQKAFEQSVLDAHIVKNIQDKKPANLDLPETELGRVSGTDVKMQKDAAAAAGHLLHAANQDLEAAQKAGNTDALRTASITASSGYRDSAHQERIYRKDFEKKYYDQTAAHRAHLRGGEHGDAAVHYMVDYIKDRIAAPGFSNHQAGLAIDFWQNRDKDHKISNSTDANKVAEWRGTWFYNWLKTNATSFGFQEYVKEPWHWTYRQHN